MYPLRFPRVARFAVVFRSLRFDTQRFGFACRRTAKVETLLDSDEKDIITNACSSMGAKRNIKSARAASEKQGLGWTRDAIFVDIDASTQRENWRSREAPCITRARGGSGGPFISKLNRRTTTSELMRLQGFHPSEIPWEKHGLSRNAVGMALGNAMSANVLQRILPRALWSAGLLSERPVDRWEDPFYNPLV